MSFYTDVIRADPRFSSTDICKDLALLEPGTRAAVQAILAEAAATGVELRVMETYRSQARQAALYARGLTQLRHVGCHGFGVACDLALYEDGEYVADGSRYGPLWALAKKHGMISGEDWGTPNQPHSFRDPDHIQRVPVRRQDAMFALRWYPPEDYDPSRDVPGDSPLPTQVQTAPLAPPPPEQPVHGAAYYQCALNTLGITPPLVVDGDWGPDSRDALSTWLQDAGRPATDGALTPAAMALLDAALKAA